MCNDVEQIDGLVINAFVERVFSPGFLVKTQLMKFELLFQLLVSRLKVKYSRADFLENLGKSLFSNFLCYWKKKIFIIQGKDKHETFLKLKVQRDVKFRGIRLVHSGVIVLNGGGHS